MSHQYQSSSLPSMASVSASPAQLYLRPTVISHGSSSLALFFKPVIQSTPHYPRLCALRAESESGRFASQDTFGADFLLRKPSVVPVEERERDGEDDSGGGISGYEEWEDRILQETVPLVGFVRMILHSGKYESGDRLSAEHENTILEKLLQYHPEFEKKIGCGIVYITIGYHPEFESSRCLFIMRRDGNLVDFSYWKCIKGLIRKNYPLYADTFILRHFRRRKQYR